MHADRQTAFLTRAGAGLAGMEFSSTALGDLNGDGTLDLVVAGHDKNDVPTTTAYLGDGDGGFSEAGADLTGVFRGSLSLGDLNGDDHLDLVVTGLDDNSDPTAKVYLGDGSGGFSEVEAGLTGVSRSSASLGDLDGDGILDLVVVGADQNGSRTAKVYLGDGSGGFSEAGAELPGVWRGSTALGDLDGDGHLDLVIAGQDESDGRVTKVYLGDGNGGFRDANAGLYGVVEGSTSLGDVDGDGILDIVLTGSDETFSNVTTKVYLGDGSGGFREAGAVWLAWLGAPPHWATSMGMGTWTWWSLVLRGATGASFQRQKSTWDTEPENLARWMRG